MKHSKAFPRFSSVMLALIMLAAAVPLFQLFSLAESPAVVIGGVEFYESDSGKEISLGGGKVKFVYDPDYGYELYLNNVNIVYNGETALYRSKKNRLTIYVDGNNSIVARNEQSAHAVVAFDEELVFKGSGVLDVSGESQERSSVGIWTDGKTVIDMDGGMIKAHGEVGNEMWVNVGIRAEGELIVRSGSLISTGVNQGLFSAKGSVSLTVASGLTVYASTYVNGAGKTAVNVGDLPGKGYRYIEITRDYPVTFAGYRMNGVIEAEGLQYGDGLIKFSAADGKYRMTLYSLNNIHTFPFGVTGEGAKMLTSEADLEIAVLGKCSFGYANGKSCTAIWAPERKITFIGDGTLELICKGYDQPDTVYADELCLKMNGSGAVLTQCECSDNYDWGINVKKISVLGGTLVTRGRAGCSAPLTKGIELGDGKQIKVSRDFNGGGAEFIDPDDFVHELSVWNCDYQYAVISGFYPVWIGDTQFNDHTVKAGIVPTAGKATLSHNGECYVLKLQDVEISDSDGLCSGLFAVYCEDDLLIEVEGNNKIAYDRDFASSGGRHTRGIFTNGELTLKGAGTLDINIKSYGYSFGIYANVLNVNMQRGKLITEVVNKDTAESAALYGESGINVIRGTITARSNRRACDLFFGSAEIFINKYYTVKASMNQGGAPQFTVYASDIQNNIMDPNEEKYKYLYFSQMLCHEVIFDVQGHGEAPPVQYVYDRARVSEPEEPEASGYVFEGWYEEPQCVNLFDFRNTPVTDDFTLYAKWVKVHTVTFNANGHGTVPIGSLEIPDGETIWDYIDKFDDVAIPDVPGYEFYDYSLYPDNDPDEFFPFETPITGDITLYAIWMEKYIPGDLNNDGAVDDSDAVYLLYYTFFPDEYPLNQPCDFNGDGAVDDSDAVYLLYHTFFPDEYPL